MRHNGSRMVSWALRSLIRSHRVRFATAVGLLFHLLSTFTLIRLAGRGDVAAFLYVTGFVPIAILATVTQGNLFGVDRGGTLAALATPVRARTFSRIRLVVAMLWTLGTLLVGWIVGLTASGAPFVPVVLLQLAFVFLLCPIGGMLSAFAPSSRTYARATGQTMPVTTLVPLNVVSLLGIGGAIELMRAFDEPGKRTILAAICVLATLLMSGAAVVIIGHLFESRRDHILDALKENP